MDAPTTAAQVADFGAQVAQDQHGVFHVADGGNVVQHDRLISQQAGRE